MVYAIDGKAGIDFTKTGSTPLYSLGATVRTNDGEYTYVKHAIAAATVGLVYKIQEDYQTVLLNTTESGSEPTNLGAAQVAIAVGSTTAQYAWLFTGYGNFEASCATGLSAGAALTTTATDGVLGAGGDAVAAALVDATTGGAAVVTCFAPGKLATNA